MTSLASALLLAGTAIAVVSLVVVHVLPTGLSPLRDPVSRYGITRYRAWYWAAAAGAAVAGVGAALLFAPVGTTIAIVTTVLVLVFAVGRALIGFFPMDAPGSRRSRAGRIHNLLATAAFASVTAAAFTGAGALHDVGAADASVWSTACGIAMAVGTIGMLTASRVSSLRVVFGLGERLIYAGFLTWFVVIGVRAASSGAPLSSLS